MKLRIEYSVGMKALFLLALLLSTNAFGKEPIKIGIVDTGLDINDPRFQGHICQDSDMLAHAEELKDTHGHGTHVAGLIKEYAGKGDYCFYVCKYYSEANSGAVNLQNEIKCFQEVVDHGANVVNMSGGGPEFNEKEYLIIRDHPNVKFVVGAGNEHESLDKVENYYYPASYSLPNEVVVGSVDEKGKKSSFSNYGKAVTVTEMGENVMSTLPNDKWGKLSGTSMSTAIRTGKIIREMLKKQ